MRKDIIGKALRKEREKRKMTQSDVALELGISLGTVSYMDQGLPMVTEEKYREYAKLLGKSDLVGMENEMDKLKETVMQELRHSEDIVTGNPKMAEELIESLASDIRLFPDAKIFATFLRGRIAFEKKDYSISKEYLEKALSGVASDPYFSKSNLQSICLNDLGRIAFYEKDFHGALEYADESISQFKDEGERSKYKPHPYINRAIYLEELNRDEEACQTLEYLYKHLDKFKTNLKVVIQIYERFAYLLAKSGLPLKALEYAQEGLQIAWENREYRRLFSIWSIMGNIYTILGRTHEAKTRYRKALALIKHVSDSPERIGRTYLDYGKLLISLNENQEAETQLTNAIKFFQSVKSKDVYLVEALITLGELKKERELFQLADEILSNHKDIGSVSVDIFLKMCDFYESESKDREKYLYYQTLMIGILREGLTNENAWRRRSNRLDFSIRINPS